MTAVNIIEADHWRLPTLSDDIVAALSESRQQAQQAVAAAIRAGTLLTEAKALVQHGQWEAWLAANCKVSARSARAYMRLAEKWPELQNGNAAAVLSLRAALAAIASPATEPAPDRPRLPTTHYPRRDARERAALTLKKSADALRALTRNVNGNFIKRNQVESVRAKLQAALAALDELQVEQEATDVEVRQ